MTISTSPPRSFTIYCHTSPSGKRYVGQTSQGMARRWRSHVSLAMRDDGPMCCAFYAAIRKHGAPGFRHEVLETVDTRDAANEAEARWIATLDSLAPHGYNMLAGGDVRDPHPETLVKLGVSQKGKWARFPPERRAALVGALVAAYTPEMRSAAGKRQWEAMSEDERHASAVRRGKGTSSEKQAIKGRSIWVGKTKEERAEMVRKSWATRRARAARAVNDLADCSSFADTAG